MAEWTNLREEQKLRKLVAQGLSWQQIAKKMGRGYNSVRGKGRSLGLQGKATPATWQLVIPDEAKRVRIYHNATNGKGDFLVIGDWQIPCTDWNLVQEALNVAEKLGLKQLIIGGDFLELSALSPFKKYVPEKIGLADELECGYKVMGQLVEMFDTIYFLSDNHWTRLAKAIYEARGDVPSPQQLARILTDSKKVKILDFCWMTVNNHWRLTHPMQGRNIPLSLATTLSAKYQSHLVCFHGHHFRLGLDISGRFVICDAGGVFDPKKLAYTQLWDTSHYVTNQGFLAIKDDRLIPFWKHPNLATPPEVW